MSSQMIVAAGFSLRMIHATINVAATKLSVKETVKGEGVKREKNRKP